MQLWIVPAADRAQPEQCFLQCLASPWPHFCLLAASSQRQHRRKRPRSRSRIRTRCRRNGRLSASCYWVYDPSHVELAITCRICRVSLKGVGATALVLYLTISKSQLLRQQRHLQKFSKHLQKSLKLQNQPRLVLYCQSPKQHPFPLKPKLHQVLIPRADCRTHVQNAVGYSTGLHYVPLIRTSMP